MTFLPVEKHARLRCEGFLSECGAGGFVGFGLERHADLRLGDWPCSPRLATVHPADFCRTAPGLDERCFRAQLYIVRKRAENEIREAGDGMRTRFTFPRFLAELSSNKGLVLASQLPLLPRSFRSGCSQRSLSGASAFFDKHFSQLGSGRQSVSLHRDNGEINTLRGNVNWMHARQIAAGIATVW